MTDQTELCIEQKEQRKKCICINIIYHRRNAFAKTAGISAANQLSTVISSSSNLEKCCPIVSVEIHTCGISSSDWANKVIPALGAEGKVSSEAEMNALFQANVCQKDNCVNLMMVGMDWGTFNGWTYGGNPSGKGFGVIKPSKVGVIQNIGAHEIGHALTLDHEGKPADNLMSKYSPHGYNLTKEQCQKIWDFIDNYPC